MLAVMAYATFNLSDFVVMVQRMSPWWLALALASVAARIVIGGWRLHFISRGRLGLSGGVRAQLAWDFLSSVTPSAVGGGPFTGFFIARDRGIAVGEATSIMLFAMLMDQLWNALAITLLLMATLWFEVIPESLGALGTVTAVLLFAGMLGYTGVFAYATLVKPEVLGHIAAWCVRLPLLRRFEARVTEEMVRLAEQSEVLRKQPLGFYLRGLGVTGVSWLMRPLLVVLLVLGVMEVAEPVLLFLRSTALFYISIVMPTPGGSGGVEGAFWLLLADMIPSTLLAPVLLAWRVLSYFLFVALGAYVLSRSFTRAAPAAPSLARQEAAASSFPSRAAEPRPAALSKPPPLAKPHSAPA